MDNKEKREVISNMISLSAPTENLKQLLTRRPAECPQPLKPVRNNLIVKDPSQTGRGCPQ